MRPQVSQDHTPPWPGINRCEVMISSSVRRESPPSGSATLYGCPAGPPCPLAFLFWHFHPMPYRACQFWVPCDLAAERRETASPSGVTSGATYSNCFPSGRIAFVVAAATFFAKRRAPRATPSCRWASCQPDYLQTDLPLGHWHCG